VHHEIGNRSQLARPNARYAVRNIDEVKAFPTYTQNPLVTISVWTKPAQNIYNFKKTIFTKVYVTWLFFKIAKKIVLPKGDEKRADKHRQ